MEIGALTSSIGKKGKGQQKGKSSTTGKEDLGTFFFDAGFFCEAALALAAAGFLRTEAGLLKTGLAPALALLSVSRADCIPVISC